MLYLKNRHFIRTSTTRLFISVWYNTKWDSESRFRTAEADDVIIYELMKTIHYQT